MENSKKTTIVAEKGKQELFIYREFDAPRELVFRALSEPDLLSMWMGPRDLETRVDKLDNHSHGSWRFIHTDPAGNEYAFNGAIHEVAEPERIIRTFEFEGMPERGHVTLEFLTLDELPGERSKIRIQVVYRSVEDRDGHIAADMERGLVDSHERLDELLKNVLLKK